MDINALQKLLIVATDKQREYLAAVIRTKSVRKAATEMGVSHQTVDKALTSMRKKLGAMTPTKEKWLIITDLQAKAGIDMLYFHVIGEYIRHKKPTKIICIGDFADMPSLSSYDKGKRSYEGARYKNDIEATRTAMNIMLAPIKKHNETAKVKYNPEMIMLLGNHEDRIDRATQFDPMLFGTISIKDLQYEEAGWKVYPFKQVIVMENIAFCHYFSGGVMGHPCGTAQQQLNKMHMSCIAGHQQGRQVATGKRADGKRITSIIAGSGYDYEMDYLGIQGNRHWRGVIMLHNIDDGEFDEVYVPISYLKEKYGGDCEPMYFTPEQK